MNLQEARDTVLKMKPQDVYMLIQLSYDKRLVLSHKDGITFLNALSQAELLTEPYNKPPELAGVQRDTLQISLLSREDYVHLKMAQLLRVTVEELKTREIAENQSPTPPTK